MTPQRPRPPAPRPAPPRARPGSAAGATAAQPKAGQPKTGQPRTAQPRTGQPTTAQPTAPTASVPASTAPAASGGPAPRAPRTAGQPATGRRTSGSAVAARTGAFPVRPPVVSQGSAARFAERARARRRLAWRQILIAAGSVAAVGALAWLLLLSPVLALDAEQIRVSGAGTVVAVDQVHAVVDTEAGTPLPRLDTAALRSALLDVPGVRDAQVTRDWPHGLSVALVSREPVAAVPEAADVVAAAEGDEAAEDGGYALVDEEGVKVGRADTPPEGLPVVEVPVGEARILAATLGVLESLPDTLLVDIGQVSAGTQDTVRLVLRDGATVEWGSAQDPALKAAVLQALRTAPDTAGAARYDVSAPTMPVVG